MGDERFIHYKVYGWTLLFGQPSQKHLKIHICIFLIPLGIYQPVQVGTRGGGRNTLKKLLENFLSKYSCEDYCGKITISASQKLNKIPFLGIFSYLQAEKNFGIKWTFLLKIPWISDFEGMKYLFFSVFLPAFSEPEESIS